MQTRCSLQIAGLAVGLQGVFYYIEREWPYADTATIKHGDRTLVMVHALDVWTPEAYKERDEFVQAMKNGELCVPRVVAVLALRHRPCTCLPPFDPVPDHGAVCIHVNHKVSIFEKPGQVSDCAGTGAHHVCMRVLQGYLYFAKPGKLMRRTDVAKVAVFRPEAVEDIKAGRLRFSPAWSYHKLVFAD